MDNILKTALQILSTSNILEEREFAIQTIKMRKEQLINTKHKYQITQNVNTLYWSSYVPIEGSKKRKLIKKKARADLIDALYAFYYPEAISNTIASLYPRWFKHKETITNRSTTTYRIDKYWHRYYLGDEVSAQMIHREISSLTKLELLEWMCHLIKTYKMKRKEYTNMSIIVRSIFQYAIDLNMLDKNEFANVSLPRSLFVRDVKKESSTQVFIQSEQARLCRAAIEQYHEHHLHNVYLLSVPFIFLTGLRLGELIALSWSDIRDDYISVNKSLMRDVKRDEDGWLPATYSIQDSLKKNAKPRKVYLTDGTRELLSHIRKHYETTGERPTYVFEKDGKTATEGALGSMWVRLCNNINILPRSPHKGRKTFVSILIDSNLPINYIRELVGHESEETTYKSYCYTRDEESDLKRKTNEALSLFPIL